MTSLGVSDRRLTPAERKVVNRYNTDSKFTHDSLLSKLKKTLQTAVEVELATIPIYLHTYYSIERKPKGFKSAMKDEKKDESEKLEKADEKVIDGEAVREENKDNNVLRVKSKKTITAIN